MTIGSGTNLDVDGDCNIQEYSYLILAYQMIAAYIYSFVFLGQRQQAVTLVGSPYRTRDN